MEIPILARAPFTLWNWDSISFGVGDEPIKRVMMAEPLKGTKRLVEELLDGSPSAGELVKNLRA